MMVGMDKKWCRSSENREERGGRLGGFGLFFLSVLHDLLAKEMKLERGGERRWEGFLSCRRAMLK